MSSNQILLYALNDFAVKAKLRTLDPATGLVTSLTTGTVRAFLATSSGPDAEPAATALEMTPEHLGDGVWLVFFDGEVLTPELLDPLFGTSAPSLIVEEPGGVRVYAPVTYTAARPATVS